MGEGGRANMTALKNEERPKKRMPKQRKSNLNDRKKEAGPGPCNKLTKTMGSR